MLQHERLLDRLIQPDWSHWDTFDPDYEVERDINAHPDSPDDKMFRYRERRYTGQQLDSWKVGYPPE